MRHHYLYNDNPEWLDWTGIICGFGLFVALIAGAITAESAPIVRKGQFCPVHYYRTGEYCAPSKATTPPAVRIIDETCPLGTYTQSNYCVSLERAK